MNFSCKSIGTIYSCFPAKFGTPRQAGLVPGATAHIKLHRQIQPEQSLEGLSGFSHIWILFLFHLNRKTSRFHAKVHPPRLDGKNMGLFATRSPHRPNPIGLSLVKLEKIQGDILWISEVDMVDGTPVLDIKPYLPQYESKSDATSGWVDGLNSSFEGSLFVHWTPEALELQKELCSNKMKNLIEKTLQLDPRPLVYKGYESSSQDETPYRNRHAVRIANIDIHFKFISSQEVLIFDIKKFDIKKLETPEIS